MASTRKTTRFALGTAGRSQSLNDDLLVLTPINENGEMKITRATSFQRGSKTSVEHFGTMKKDGEKYQNKHHSVEIIQSGQDYYVTIEREESGVITTEAYAARAIESELKIIS